MAWKRVLDHEQKGEWWRPKNKGDAVEGRLMAVDMGQNGPFLVVETSDKVLNVGVSTVLERLPWDQYVGKLIRIVYQETLVSKTGRTYMLFDVDVEA